MPVAAAQAGLRLLVTCDKHYKKVQIVRRGEYLILQGQHEPADDPSVSRIRQKQQMAKCGIPTIAPGKLVNTADSLGLGVVI